MNTPQKSRPQSQIDLKKPVWQWTMLLSMAFIWGTSFILMKKGLQSYTYTQVAAFRMFLSFVFLIPLIVKNLKKLKEVNLTAILLVAFIGVAIPSLLFTKSQTQINSSLAGMLNSLSPLFTMIIGMMFFKISLKRYNIMGVVLGMIGAGGLMFKGQTGIFDQINIYAFFIVLATVCYGFNSNYVKLHLTHLDGITITSLTFLMIGPVAGIYLLFSDFSMARASAHPIVNLGYIAILALCSSALGMIMYNTLIRYTSALFVSSATYIIPVFAIFWGILDGEVVSPFQFLWISVIFLGVYLVNRK